MLELAKRNSLVKKLSILINHLDLEDFMTHLFKILLVLIGFSVSFQAQAILIDPYMGFVTSGNMEQSGNDIKITGQTIGARLGMSTLGFAVGVDYMTGSLTYSGAVKSTYTPGHLGLFVSYDFPILVRGYATYFPVGVLNGDVKLEGNGTKLGVMYTGLPFVAIGLELLNMSYSKTDGNDMAKATEKVTLLAISLPLDL